MGGAADVRSRPGEGSAFWFTVRVGVPPGAVASEPEGDGDGLRGRRVLVVGGGEVALRKPVL